MQRQKTKLRHSNVANDMMYYIIHHIDTGINIDEMAYEFGISKFHLQRIFKAQLGANIYETIKSVRLQKAANLLIANRHYTITEIGNMCGYSILTSFLRAFRHRFGQTPKQWRNGGHLSYCQSIPSRHKRSLKASDFDLLKPRIKTVPDRHVYYIRHRGYGEALDLIWGRLSVWTQSNSIKEFHRIGVYYDNPAITPLQQCYFVACIEPIGAQNISSQSLPKSHLRGGSHAVFTLEGDYEDILRLIQWAYHYWLPHSGFSTTSASSYCIFEDQEDANKDEVFTCHYHLPITL